MKDIFRLSHLNRPLLILMFFWLVVASLITSNLPLHYDEAYYWVLSNHLDLGFYDHPPLTVYLLRISRAIFGENEFAVRLPSILFQLFSIFLMFVYLEDLTKNRKISFWWTVIYSVMPLAFLWGGLGMNSDAGVITFAILSTLLFKRAVNGDKLANWIYFGASFGLGVVTKFTFPVLLPGLFLYLVLSKSRRVQLIRKEIYIAILVAAIIFLPFLYWNFQHDFVTFRFNFLIRYDPWHFRGWYLQNTIQLMLMLFGPIPLILSTVYVVRSIKKLQGRSDELDPAFFIQLTLIPFFIYIGSGSLIKWHYMIVLCFPVVINSLLFFSTSSQKVVRGFGIASIIIPIIAMSMVIGGVIKVFHEPKILFGETAPDEHKDPTLNRDATTLFGTSQVGEYLDDLLVKLNDKGEKDLFLVASDYREASQISFYTPSHPEVFLVGYEEMFGRNYVYFRQQKEAELVGKNAVMLTQYPSAIPNISSFFASSEKIGLFYIKDNEGNKLRLFHFFLCRNYQGDSSGILDIDPGKRK